MIICRKVRGMNGQAFNVLQSDKPYTRELADTVKNVRHKYSNKGFIRIGNPIPSPDGTFSVPVDFDLDVVAMKLEGDTYVHVEYENTGEYVDLDKLGWRFL